MINPNSEYKVTAPGRVCLFGEHQDYLNLPVIPCAISLRINIEGGLSPQRDINLDLPDINSHEFFHMNGELDYKSERDYFKSTMNVLKKSEYTFSKGFEGNVKSTIPINSGTSSSSALIVAWVKMLSTVSDQSRELTPEEVAAFAFKAEVEEFNEPGGKMDMYSSALGGTIFLEFEPELKVTRLNSSLKTIVLGDSGEPKKTTEILSRVKDGVLEVIDVLKLDEPDFTLYGKTLLDIDKYKSKLNETQMNLLRATITNYQITLKSKELLSSKEIDHREIGRLLTMHHKILNADLGISTPKIERMLDAALDAGAYGGKINGSGGGGCMFAYAPENPELVAKAIEKEGGKAYIINPDKGVELIKN